MESKETTNQLSRKRERTDGVAKPNKNSKEERQKGRTLLSEACRRCINYGNIHETRCAPLDPSIQLLDYAAELRWEGEPVFCISSFSEAKHRKTISRVDCARKIAERLTELGNSLATAGWFQPQRVQFDRADEGEINGAFPGPAFRKRLPALANRLDACDDVTIFAEEDDVPNFGLEFCRQWRNAQGEWLGDDGLSLPRRDYVKLSLAELRSIPELHELCHALQLWRRYQII